MRLNCTKPLARGWRIHLRAWLDFAERHGGLDADRESRLRRIDSWQAWNQALNEVRIPYFISRVFGFAVEYVQPQDHVRTPDIRARKNGLTVNIEIKTYGQEGPHWQNGVRALAKDKPAIIRALNEANSQFKGGGGDLNVLAIGAHLLQESPTDDDTALIEALYGQEVMTCRIDRATGNPIGEPEVRFVRSGKMQHNRFTTTSAVFTLVDGMTLLCETRSRRASHRYSCVMHHNPHAKVKLPTDLFFGTRQLVFDEDGKGKYLWPDGKTYTFWGF